MFKQFLSVLVIFVSFKKLEFQLLQSGNCPVIYSVPNFNILAFSGTWYDVANIPIPTLNLGKCVSANYNVDSLNVVHISINYYDGKQMKQLNNAFTITNSTGAYYIQIPAVNMNFEFAIIDTDYSTYGVTYGCAKLGRLKIQLAWILSRKPTLSYNFYAKAISALKQRKLPYKNMKNITQTYCPTIY
ncbi:hypothetical protein PVAND_005404 [Polypedilum vanderplanki]|uniref:Lipocalin/cytosolic fatty-acid binding domain-containing protein n=1 Tax=Polypedilum vanderplanki TaxID=319348 RepID=A0A9J6C027_POLVA|nr:hypothetical protein PVAND_005404 [Polypedilum vanderplanki]